MTADGKAIKRGIWHGLIDSAHEKFVQLFLSRNRPGETVLSLWRRGCRKLLIIVEVMVNSIQNRGKLETQSTGSGAYIYQQIEYIKGFSTDRRC
jgi:hypothetical protein